MTEERADRNIRLETLKSLEVHLHAMVRKHKTLATKEEEKGRKVKASQHSFAANVLREEIKWLDMMGRNVCD